jgi:riboflavin kinase
MTTRLARVSAELPDAPLAELRHGRAALLITPGADGFPAVAFTWTVALDASTVRFGADHGSSGLANLERAGRASLQVIADQPFLIKGPVAPVRASIEAARRLGIALWEMLVTEVRDQSWPGARVHPLAYDWAPERRAEMRALEQSVLAEMRETPRPPLSGTVVTGQGRGSAFTAVPWARDRLRTLLGAEAWPGTLNLRIDDPGSLARWKALAARAGSRLSSPEGGACDARAYAALIGAVPVLILVPEVPGYPENQIELVAERPLRSQLGLADGDTVAVHVTRRPAP